jgi:hypothetical protein
MAKLFALAALLAVTPLAGRAADPAEPAAAEATPPASGSLDRVLNERIDVDEAARASQQRIEKLDDETQKLLTEYRKALSDTESYARYADQLRAQIGSQTEEMTAIDQQLRLLVAVRQELRLARRVRLLFDRARVARLLEQLVECRSGAGELCDQRIRHDRGDPEHSTPAHHELLSFGAGTGIRSSSGALTFLATATPSLKAWL